MSKLGVYEVAGCYNFHEGICAMDENPCASNTQCKILQRVKDAQDVIETFSPNFAEED